MAIDETNITGEMGPIGQFGYNPFGQVAAGPGALGGMPYNSAGQLGFLPGSRPSAPGGAMGGPGGMSGEPFTQQVQNNMYSTASDMNSAAQAARDRNAVSAAVAGGAAPTDPSLAMEKQNSAARASSDNADAENKIQSEAQVANSDYGLKEQGLGMEQQRINLQQQSQNMNFLQSMYGGGGWNPRAPTGQAGLPGNSNPGSGGWGGVGFLPESASSFSGHNSAVDGTGSRQGGPWGNGNNSQQQYQQEQNDPNTE